MVNDPMRNLTRSSWWSTSMTVPQGLPQVTKSPPQMVDLWVRNTKFKYSYGCKTQLEMVVTLAITL